MLQPVGKDRWQPGPDDRVRRALYVVVGADVFVFPFLRVDDPETKLWVSIAGLAHTAHIDETLDAAPKCICQQILADDTRDMCVADETD